MKKGSKNFIVMTSAIGLIFVPAVATYSLATQSTINEVKRVEGKKIINNVNFVSTLEKKDLSVIEKKINMIQSSFDDTSIESEVINYKDIFRSSVIMGDSQSEGLTIYGVLNTTSVIAHKGSNLVEAKSSMNILSNLSPSNVFTLYGMNDILAYEENIDAFIKDYTELIKSIKETLPNSNVFVNAVLPVTEQVKDKRPIYNKIDEYNSALKLMCSELDITFVDASELLINNQEFYAGDGMHFKPIFYPSWLDILIDSAHL